MSPMNVYIIKPSTIHHPSSNVHPTVERWSIYRVWFQLLNRIGWVLLYWFARDGFSIKPGPAVTGGSEDYDDGITCHVSRVTCPFYYYVCLG